MRQGQQHRRGRGRNNNNNSNNNNNRRGHNPLARSFESNGPDVKVRGTPADIAAKYLTLARDAQSSGDPVLAENYFQHAEHYNRIIMAYREQQQQQQPNDGSGGQNPRYRQDGGSDGDEMGDDDGQDDVGMGDQPPMVRGSGDQARMGGDTPRHEDGQPQRHGDQQQQRHGDHQPRFRDRQDQRFQRHDRGDRDRGERRDRFDRGPDRGDRQDRGDRHDRGDRFDRGDRHGRGEHRFERGDRDQRGFDRPPPHQQGYPQDDAHSGDRASERPAPVIADRAAVERMPIERPVYDRPVAERAPVVERPVVERPLEAAETRLPPPPVAKAVDGETAGGEAPVRAPRGEAAARRRERFGLGSDQPEFLRRPVRRPRREAEGTAPAGPVASAGDEPSGQD